MLNTSRRNLSRILSVGVSVKRFEGGIPSLNEIKKPEDDYHPSKYTILGNKRKDPMHYTDRKVGRGYWHFSNTIFQSRPKIHPKLAKGLKRNFYIIFALSLGLCFDYDWYVISMNKLVMAFVSVNRFLGMRNCQFFIFQVKDKDIHKVTTTTKN